MRARLDVRAVGVGGREDPGGHRLCRGGRSAVVPAAVEALVVARGDGGERRQGGRPAEHALGVVGVQPDLLPLVRGQSGRLGPHGTADGHPAEIVHQPAAAHAGHVVGGQAQACTRLRRASSETACACPWKQLAITSANRPIAASARSSSAGPVVSQGFGSSAKRGLPDRPGVVRGEQACGVVDATRSATAGSKACPDRSRITRAAASAPPTNWWNAASRATWMTRMAIGIRSPRALLRGPRPSQRAVRSPNRSRTPGRHAEVVAEHLGDLAHRVEVAAVRPAGSRHPDYSLKQTERCGAVGIGQGAQDPQRGLPG